MSTEYVKWSDVKAKARALDPRTDVERELAAATERERREAYMRGHQLAETLFTDLTGRRTGNDP